MCPYCFSPCINYGSSSIGNKRYRCKSCKRTHSKVYVLKACRQSVSEKIKSLLKEGCGIRSIARLLKIRTNTVLRRIKHIAKQLKKPLIPLGKEYELDELCTYVKSKNRKRWITYAIRKDTRD